MKRILLILSVFLSLESFSQLNVVLHPADTLLCFKDSLRLTATVTGSGTLHYTWQKENITIPGAPDTLSIKIDSVMTADTGYYRVIVTNGTDTDTSNTVHIRIYPKMNIDTLYRYNELGCPGTCKGQFFAHVSGGKKPYLYQWGGGHSQDTIVFGLCQGTYTFRVIDSNNCVLKKQYYVDVLRMPKVTFTHNPKDTIFLTNPTVHVEFPDSMRKYMTNWEWNFGDSARLANVNPAAHTYSDSMPKSKMYLISLNYTDLDGCDTTLVDTLKVVIAKLIVPNVFTPNGDGHNDAFEIKVDGYTKPELKDYRELYLSTELVIIDRWGRKVFEANNYKSGDWNGGKLPDGVYNYILKCNGQYGTDVFHGSVTILAKEFTSPN
jgi:gliding motility-associated-like protein